ncbi:MAG: lytic murein transglycosylase, partial [Geminicoccaceae bacterium]|nr:lytic murein transglycosylase [Geminicoccaceae bacterium]
MPRTLWFFALLIALVPRPAPAATFDAWLDAFREDARAAGIGAVTLDRALDGLSPIERVIELDRRQVESRMNFETYRTRVLSADRISQGRRLMAEHQDLLERIGRDFGVQPRFIVALWGIESTFGAYKGTFPVVQALATLAWEGRRASFFRSELINALKIIDAGDIAVEDMKGSWAGAMGQSQFMPSSFVRFAVDYDGDGRRDIWTSTPDVLASIANYLSEAGWTDRYTWGREVLPPATLDPTLVGLEVKKPLPVWQELGV